MRKPVPSRAFCNDCPYSTGSLERRIRQMVHGKTFDLRTVDGAFDALDTLLRACGATVIHSAIDPE